MCHLLQKVHLTFTQTYRHMQKYTRIDLHMHIPVHIHMHVEPAVHHLKGTKPSAKNFNAGLFSRWQPSNGCCTLTAVSNFRKTWIPEIYHFSLKILLKKTVKTKNHSFFLDLVQWIISFPSFPPHQPTKNSEDESRTYGHSATSSGGVFSLEKTHAADAQLWSARWGEWRVGVTLPASPTTGHLRFSPKKSLEIPDLEIISFRAALLVLGSVCMISKYNIFDISIIYICIRTFFLQLESVL